MGESDSAIALLLFTIIFFAVTCFFSLNSTKIVGIGWLVFAIAGAIIGYIFSLVGRGQASVMVD